MVESQQRRLQANESIKRRQEDACERRRTAVLEMQERIEAERVAMLQEMLAKKEEALTRRLKHCVWLITRVFDTYGNIGTSSSRRRGSNTQKPKMHAL